MTKLTSDEFSERFRVKNAMKKKTTGVGTDVEKLEPLALLVGMLNGAAGVQNSLVLPQKI